MRWLLRLIVPLAAVASTSAAHLPIKTYTTADGLAHDAVERIAQDSRGYLWFCTQGGLSRFDGYGFKTFGKADGLPSDHVLDLLEARDGVYWIATIGGLASFNPVAPTPDRLFSVHRLGDTPETNQVRCLLEGEDGSIWAGTLGGPFRLEKDGATWRAEAIGLGESPQKMRDIQVNALSSDMQGGVWIGTRMGGLYRRWKDGRSTRHLLGRNIRSLHAGGDGTLWVSGRNIGVVRLSQEGPSGQVTTTQEVTTRQGLPDDFARDTLLASDGTLFVATEHGLGLVTTNGPSSKARGLGLADGLSQDDLADLAEDRDGNVWMATVGGGVMKLLRGGFTSYRGEDGLRESRHAAVLESRRGDLLVASMTDSREVILQRFDGARFQPFRLAMKPADIGWGWSQIVVQARSGEWWVATGAGLYKFPAIDDLARLARTPPEAVYTMRDGLGSDEIFRLFEDSRGDLWMSAGRLVRRNKTSGRFRLYGPADGYHWGWTSAFAEDRGGNIWIGIYGGGLVRHREGRFTLFGPAEGMADGAILSLHVDEAGRLWVGTDAGVLASADDPTTDKPTFRLYGTAAGLAGGQVTTITEDRWGRIYLGSDRGVDRLEPATGSIRHYTVKDGLPFSRMGVGARDTKGDIWLTTIKGVCRLEPVPDPPRHSPPVFISLLRIAGALRALSPLGEVEMEGLRLGTDGGPLEVEFTGLDFTPGEVLRYQYRLQGAGSEWSDPSERRAVTYAGLSPGRYRFEVRAVNSAGQISSLPASVSFGIPVSVWRRWWFMSLMAMALALVAVIAHRHRVRRLLELERVRARIATDLHDDVGSTLTQVTILSEVALRQIGQEAEGAGQVIRRIAAISRETVDAMSDIVWSIDPQRDRASDLGHRMRRFAGEICSGRGIQLEMNLPGDDSSMVLPPDTRRQVLLVFKECLNNAVRHSGCARITVGFRVDRRSLLLTVTDDGSGLGSVAVGEGHGLASMRRRAELLRGLLEFLPATGGGTTVSLRVPLAGRPGGLDLSEQTGGRRSGRW